MVWRCMICLDVRTSSCRPTLPKTRFVSRGATTFDIFLLGVSPVEAVLGELHASAPRMRRSDFFEIAD